MLDGVQLCAMTALWLGLLFARGGRRQAIGAGLIAGLAGSALLLLKAPVLLPVLVSGVALRWLDRDLTRAAWSGLVLGLVLGLLPGLAWHGWHLLQRGDEALVMWGRQGLSRFSTTVEKHSGGPIEPILEVLEGGWPWLPLWPIGLVMAWRCRNQVCGRWSLGLSLTTAVMVLPMKTQLPWYTLLFWPPFCLICAPPLAALLDPSRPRGLLRRLPWFWTLLGALLLLAALATLLPAAEPLIRYRTLSAPAGLGLLCGGLLLTRPSAKVRRRGLVVLTTGWCLSLLLFFHSTLWNWELNERWSVLPVAELARGVITPAGQPPPPILMAGNASQRPSLRWYAGRELFRLPGRNPADWPERFFLIHRPGEEEIRLPPGVHCRIEAQGGEGWQRWRCAKP
jgi:4-amino-4-deoxy-L-arabinose transferase-like glycosyltransferase